MGLQVDKHFNGLDLRVTGKEPNGSWRLQGQGVHGEVIAPESCLQAVAPPPVRKERKTAAEVAKGAASEWLQGTLEEASGIAATLEQSAQTLREGLEPKASSEALREAYREAKRNFTDVAELRGALEAMGKGKTGRSMAVEQLLHLEDRELEPWLLITKMFFAGEVVDELKLGTVSPLPKDQSRFRPVTLLEPIYKCCMSFMSAKLMRVLHENKLLDLAQYGFVIDESCVEPLTIMARLFEQGRDSGGGEEIHVALLDATSAFDSVPHTALDAAMRRLGAPDDFITWLRSVLSGHQRVAATSYAVDSADTAVVLGGGTPQGCPASPTIWVIVVDFALACAQSWPRRRRSTGYSNQSSETQA